MRLGWGPGNEARVDLGMRLGWGPGNEARVDLGMRLGWGPGNEARVDLGMRLGWTRERGCLAWHIRKAMFRVFNGSYAVSLFAFDRVHSNNSTGDQLTHLFNSLNGYVHV